MTQGRKENEVFIKVIDVTYDESCGGIVTASRARGKVEKGSPLCITYYWWSKMCPRSLLMLINDVDTFDGM